MLGRSGAPRALAGRGSRIAGLLALAAAAVACGGGTSDGSASSSGRGTAADGLAAPGASSAAAPMCDAYCDQALGCAVDLASKMGGPALADKARQDVGAKLGDCKKKCKDGMARAGAGSNAVLGRLEPCLKMTDCTEFLRCAMQVGLGALGP
ncbi:MAG: hypothetical protein IT373_01285 [Polyangiaceae bacterium]|nr:hypothetical protein [Polyangiaceae bacterium]